jgi:hypothetical protein
MTKEEKILLLQLILEDIRGSWVEDIEDRAEAAKKLAEELGYPHMVESIDRFKRYIEEGETDGRHFRCDFVKYGGYIGMEKLHGLEKTLEGKSKDFQWECYQELVFPEFRLEDWDDVEKFWEDEGE